HSSLFISGVETASLIWESTARLCPQGLRLGCGCNARHDKYSLTSTVNIRHSSPRILPLLNTRRSVYVNGSKPESELHFRSSEGCGIPRNFPRCNADLGTIDIDQACQYIIPTLRCVP